MDGNGEHKVFIAPLNCSMLRYGNVDTDNSCRNRGSVLGPVDESLIIYKGVLVSEGGIYRLQWS